MSVPAAKALKRIFFIWSLSFSVKILDRNRQCATKTAYKSRATIESPGNPSGKARSYYR